MMEAQSREELLVEKDGSTSLLPFSDFNVQMKHLEVYNGDSDSGNLKRGLRFCISNRLPSDANAAGPWANLEQLHKTLILSCHYCAVPIWAHEVISQCFSFLLYKIRQEIGSPQTQGIKKNVNEYT